LASAENNFAHPITIDDQTYCDDYFTTNNIQFIDTVYDTTTGEGSFKVQAKGNNEMNDYFQGTTEDIYFTTRKHLDTVNLNGTTMPVVTSPFYLNPIESSSESNIVNSLTNKFLTKNGYSATEIDNFIVDMSATNPGSSRYPQVNKPSAWCSNITVPATT
jgi:hypothetical protein